MEKKVGKHNNNNDNDDDKMFVMTYKKASTNLNKILGFQQTEKLSLHVSKYFSMYLHICFYFDACMNTVLAHINNQVPNTDNNSNFRKQSKFKQKSLLCAYRQYIFSVQFVLKHMIRSTLL